MREQMMKELEIRKQWLLAGYGCVVILYAVSLWMLLVNVHTAIVLINGNTFFYFFVMRRLDKNYNRRFARTNLLFGSGKQLTDARVRAKGGITSRYLAECGLFPIRTEGGGVACGMELEGRRAGVWARLCEMTVCYNLPALAGKRKVGLLDGVWMELELEENMGPDLVLAAKGALQEGVCEPFYLGEGLRELTLKNRRAAETYRLFAGDEMSDDRVNRVLRKCGALMDKAEEEGCELMMRIRGERMYAFLNRRGLSDSTPVRGKVTEEILTWDRVPELKMLMDVAKGIR